MITKRNILNTLIIITILGFAAGCKELSTGEDEKTGKDEIPAVYFYTVDEFPGGIFNSMSPAFTMNNWFLTITYPASNYDSWTQKEKISIYKDDKLQAPYSGSDLINKDSVFYCEKSLNGQGKKTGGISGTITLTDIPSPGTKVQIHTLSFSQYPTYWWNLYKEINLSSVTGTSATLNWSLPVYETFKPKSESTFELIILPDSSLNSYTVTLPNKTLGNVNDNIGNIGTISIKGVTLSGTININYDGNPVPYLELYALYDVQDLLNITCLSSPEPDAQWSLTYGKNKNTEVDIKFQIIGYSEKNKNNMLFDIFVKNIIIIINDNQDKSGIVIDIGDVKKY